MGENYLGEFEQIVLLAVARLGAKALVFDIESKGKPYAGRSNRFVNEGGVLITVGVASFLPAEFGITRQVDASRPSAQFYAPGPLVEAEITRPSHPIFYGYGQK